MPGIRAVVLRPRSSNQPLVVQPAQQQHATVHECGAVKCSAVQCAAARGSAVWFTVPGGVIRVQQEALLIFMAELVLPLASPLEQLLTAPGYVVVGH